ncbi:putative glycoside hydrolase family 16 protein [Diaporthe ampelina]|uniref:Crh-like protein n=1 Tax=Diaporthe ampelina TaxID=1214573 RepID=A0A0G2HN91_9PEZI|nr:putative glycoside hydrolase family 16 protein [Diaporthe ampelina]
MLPSLLLPVGSAVLAASSVLAAKCGREYGECGVGAYCLGGCDPRFSFSLDSCVPEPVCESRSLSMDSLDRVQTIDKYLGDPSEADWVSSGDPLVYKDNVLLTMPAYSAGTVLASTVYMWYGNVKARMKSSRGNGVVSAFILLSDVKDEIDFEFIGADLETVQTNYYYQANPVWTNSKNITDLSDTYQNFHDYEIQWTPDQVVWLVDGKVGRTLKKSDTWNATTNQYDFPQTPARVQLSIWPGGNATNSEYTIEWAGGEIDWNSEDIRNYGYDFATFSEVSIECYNASSAPGTNKGKSYYYKDAAGTNDTVVDSDKPTVLASLSGTGTDMEAGASSASASSSANSVPGGTSGSGVGNVVGGDGSGSSDGSSGGSSTSSSADCAATGFTVDCNSDSSSGSSSGAVGGNDKVFGASAFAAIVAFVFLAWL